MTIISIFDRAEEFRITISGRFADDAVGQAATAWEAALSVNTPRRISVDITSMTGYDRAGFLLLREIYSHGTHVAAGTPQSLSFLTQISSSGSALPKRKPAEQKPFLQTRTAVAGR